MTKEFIEEEEGSEEMVLAYPRNMLSLPSSGMVFNATLLRALPEPQFYLHKHLKGNAQFKRVVPFITIWRDGKIATYVSTKWPEAILGLSTYVTADDGDYLSAYVRFFYEQVNLKSALTPEARVIGLINDESTEFGRTHLGVVHAVHFPFLNEKDPQVSLSMEDLKMIGFLPQEQLLSGGEPFSPWSQIILNNFEVLRIPQMGIPL